MGFKGFLGLISAHKADEAAGDTNLESRVLICKAVADVLRDAKTKSQSERITLALLMQIVFFYGDKARTQ